MKKRIVIDKFENSTIYYDRGEDVFVCKYNGENFRCDNLRSLKRNLQEESIKKFTGTYFIKSYDGIRKFTAKRKFVDSYSGETMVIGMEEDKYGSEKGDSVNITELYPDTKHNRDLFEKAKATIKRGWSIIHKGERLANELKSN